MQRERRLRRRADFEAVQRRGRSFAHPLLIVRSRPNGQDLTRWGFAVGKRVGGAVIRNRVRRRLREIARQAPVRQGMDIVIIARPGAATAAFGALRETTFELLRRAKLTAPPAGPGEPAGLAQTGEPD